MLGALPLKMARIIPTNKQERINSNSPFLKDIVPQSAIDIQNQTTIEPESDSWLEDLREVVTDPGTLLEQLNISIDGELEDGFAAKKLFNLRVPKAFIGRMQQGNIHDPLLKQVLTVKDEFLSADGFVDDPLDEQDAVVPGLLHKYKSRVLMILKGSCAINCRYCFRRHFPYEENPGNKKTWQLAINYISEHSELDEVILSGGDPLMAKDHELAWLIERIEAIHHIRTLRIHTRLAIVIPNRITEQLTNLFANSRLNIVLVTHINHAQEIDDDVILAMRKLKSVNVTLLNQSVLLKGINNSVEALKLLSHSLFDAGILPYYLHLLDKVNGAAHFYVTDDEAKLLMKSLIKEVSGFLVPKLTREISGEASKTPINFLD